MEKIRYGISLIAALLGGSGAAAAADTAPHPVPAYSEIKDWLVACDNVRGCEAKGFTDDQSGVWMSIQRAAGPKGSLAVEFDAEGAIKPALVQLDGKPVALTGGDVKLDSSNGAEDASIRFAEADAYNFIRAVRNGKLLSLDPPKTENRRMISLDGLAAVLLLMDDVQGRVGTETALARTGPAPASAVPPEPPLPAPPAAPADPGVLPEPKAKALIAAIRGNPALMKPAHCEDDAGEDDDGAGLLAPDTALVMVSCLRGAYQSSVAVFTAPVDHPDQAHRLTLSLPLAKDPVDLFTSADYDAPTHALSMSAKGRGIADCGESAEWIYDGKQFQLVSLESQQKCGGAPGDWTTLWRSAEPAKP